MGGPRRDSKVQLSPDGKRRGCCHGNDKPAMRIVNIPPQGKGELSSTKYPSNAQNTD